LQQGLELGVERLDLGVEVLHPPTELAQGSLGHRHHRIGVRGRAQPRGLGHHLVGVQALEPDPELVGGAERQVANLAQRGDAMVAPRAPGDVQHPHGLDVAGAPLELSVRLARQRRLGGRHGIDWIGLAWAMARLTVGAVHLDDFDAGAGEEPGQLGAIRAGALHPHPGHRPERGEPGDQLLVAGPGDLELLDSAWPPIEFTAAATRTSRWVSTPPQTAAVSNMVMTTFSSLVHGQGVARSCRGGGLVAPGLLEQPRAVTPPTGECRTQRSEAADVALAGSVVPECPTYPNWYRCHLATEPPSPDGELSRRDDHGLCV
jgi:hypothetical protein